MMSVLRCREMYKHVYRVICSRSVVFSLAKAEEEEKLAQGLLQSSAIKNECFITNNTWPYRS